MAERFDVVTPRKRKDKEGNEKTFWVKVGTAWFSDTSKQIVFDALPIPDAEGRCVVMLFEPKTQQPEKSSGGSFADMKDDIPF